MILLAILALVAAGSATNPPLAASSLPQTTGPDTCAGDEQFSFAPTNPRVGTELLIAVTSATYHSFPRLTGTESPTFYRDRKSTRLNSSHRT